jgi:hypothetical protein
MKTKTYIEKVSIPECTQIHHVWSFDGESPEIGSLCECGQCRWDDSHLTQRAADLPSPRDSVAKICPHCGFIVVVSSRGRFHNHGSKSNPCPGSGEVYVESADPKYL